MAEGLRFRRRGNLLFAFNYGNAPRKLPAAGKILLGKRMLAPQDVAIIRL
jgi:hypothetical protein